ncbi:HET-domain-containing protein [Hypoxylon crocopeplum]|nr:HET-domain-containing protein [Hypoxylon crocopeplum]
MMAETQLDSELRLCDFCRSVDWTSITTGRFDPQNKTRQNGNGQLKSGEHNLGLIRAATACELCALIGEASRTLKKWWPIAHLLDQPEKITCAFWSKRNRLGSSVQTKGLAQAETQLDRLFASLRPGYSSDKMVAQEFLDSLADRGIFLDGEGENSGGSEKRRVNSSFNRLLVLAGKSPVSWTSQTFMQLHPCIHPIPSVDDYVAGEAPFTAFPTGRIVHPKVNVQLLRKWYETCANAHGTKCSEPPWLTSDTSWPAKLRLIDVNRHCLVETPEPCSYFALSYVWGGETNPFQTILANVEEMKTPDFLKNQLLPKTIVDAMELTKEMGVDFLWVDRLCVIQDSDIDQAVQIPQMDLVYSRAEMTIVATSGTAVDGLAGINGTSRVINQRTARVAQDLSLMDVLRLDQSYQDSRWTTRGWTFQEGLCSRRTLIITSNQIFWSCESAKCCESIAFEAFPTTVAANDIIFDVLSGHRVFGEFGGGNNFAYGELDSMIQSYCTRKLTVQADALDAFTGVLRRVEVNTGHDFYWGHSVSVRFDESLAWCNIEWYQNSEWQEGDTPVRRRELHRVRSAEGTVNKVQFPSWSWLGWSRVHGVTRPAPRQIVLEPELDIMKLSLDGKAAPLHSRPEGKKLESVSRLDMCGVDSSTSMGWKGDTAIDASLLHRDAEDGEFRDSGRLLFWTSHAVLDTEDGKIYNDKKEQVGELKLFWPNQVQKPTGKYSFIVVSRKFNDNTIKVLKAEKILYVLAVEWDDPVKRVASRICSGEVEEAAWVGLGEAREWILVTLA